jgi:hypothetical protein
MAAGASITIPMIRLTTVLPLLHVPTGTLAFFLLKLHPIYMLCRFAGVQAISSI